jgi:hypothetical protein
MNCIKQAVIKSDAVVYVWGFSREFKNPLPNSYSRLKPLPQKPSPQKSFTGMALRLIDLYLNTINRGALIFMA